MTSLPQARRFDWTNFAIRAASAAVLIPGVLLIVWFSRPLFLVMMAIATAILSLEWGKMSASRAPIRVATVVTVAVLAVGFLAYLRHDMWAGAALALGALAAALLARGVSERPGDAAYGVIYLSPAMYSLIWLHAELIFKAKMAAAEKLLANPQIRERLKAVLAAQIQNPT